MAGRRRLVPSPAMGVALFAVVLALGGQSAYAAATNFLLNTTNTSSSTTTLSASKVAGTGLKLTNKNSNATATALGLSVASGHPPFTVNSSTRVANLNADKLDGLDSSMLESHILFQASAAGALNGSFVSHGGPVLITVNGSGYSTSGGEFIGYDISIDGGTAILACRVFTNEANSHKACVPQAVGGLSGKTLSAGQHSFTIQKDANTAADQLDTITVSILEFTQ
jgi:hypothetical protein